MDEKVYTPKQVAEILQVHPYTILKWIRAGKLKAIKVGRVYRIQSSDLAQFLTGSATAPTPPQVRRPIEVTHKQQHYELQNIPEKTVHEIPEEKRAADQPENDHYNILLE